MNKKIKIIIILIATLLILGGVYAWNNLDSDVVVVPVNNGGQSTTNTQDIDVQKLHVSKESFDNIADRDLDLAVGDTFGKFKITRITDTVSGPNRIYFSGEETVRGQLQFSNFFGGVYFKADIDEVSKLPQIFKNIYNKLVFIDGLVINGSSKITRSDFTFNQSGESNIIMAEVKLTNLMLVIPPVEGFGSADAVEIRILK